MKLKTLKDLTIQPSLICKKDGRLIIEKELKQEAIKRVKSCCPNDNIGGTPLRKAEYCGGCRRDVWFNNLTEEDLVEKKEDE